MKYLLITLSALLLIILSGCDQEQKLEARYKKSVAWLWEQQGEDGGWHSQTHAVLRDGRALTPYILYYLLDVPEHVYPKKEDAIAKAVAFIQHDIEAAFTVVGDSTVELNYPNYSAAYALRVLHRLNTDPDLQRALARYLLSQQFSEQRGISPQNLAYGGWGYGEPNLPYGTHGHVDISHTRRIVESLMESGFLSMEKNHQVGSDVLSEFRPDSIDTFRLAAQRLNEVDLFLLGAQRNPDDFRLYEGCTSRKLLPYDGGFVASVATLATTKSQPLDIEGAGLHYPSYATATCDGLLLMHALGYKDLPQYHDARSWLEKHQNISEIAGLATDDPEQWYLVMHYYHWAVRSEAMTAPQLYGTWKKDLKTAFIKEQREDGSFMNPLGGVNKEDDPLMATIFCIQAITELHKF